jgi:hypothetical protein
MDRGRDRSADDIARRTVAGVAQPGAAGGRASLGLSELAFPKCSSMVAANASNGGFDAVIGNPPWTVLPLRRLSPSRHRTQQPALSRSRVAAGEARRADRIDPASGIATDHGARMRRDPFDRTTIVPGSASQSPPHFPIHRSVRFGCWHDQWRIDPGRAFRTGLDDLRELQHDDLPRAAGVVARANRPESRSPHHPE